MAKVQWKPEILPAEASVRRLPDRDGTVRLLFMPTRVGAMEPEAGRIGSFGVRAGHHCGRHPVAIPGHHTVAGNITHGGGKGRGKVNKDSGGRGGH